MHPFFLLIINPEILFSRFLICYNFYPSFNEYANYLYRRNWNRPINPVRPYPWFYWGERQIACITTPVLWLLPLNSQHLNFQFPITSIFKFVRSRRDPKEKLPGRVPTVGAILIFRSNDVQRSNVSRSRISTKWREAGRAIIFCMI